MPLKAKTRLNITVYNIYIYTQYICIMNHDGIPKKQWVCNPTSSSSRCLQDHNEIPQRHSRTQGPQKISCFFHSHPGLLGNTSRENWARRKSSTDLALIRIQKHVHLIFKGVSWMQKSQRRAVAFVQVPKIGISNVDPFICTYTSVHNRPLVHWSNPQYQESSQLHVYIYICVFDMYNMCA